MIDDDFEEIQSVSSDTSDIAVEWSYVSIVKYSIWFLLWITLYVIFLKLQFGLVYLVVSALFGIYLNTRTRSKRPNEISAYSVFNKNCESIDGTLNAEQFERELLYRK